ncbi:hypothetical protein BJP36_39760 [Moorena producens JHB]|uniref:Tetratricopeptide repeat protein n=1 Tax=Moorena producens (strain JHB) TaxID=1454205 RepID=A0A9Q9UWS0_MOOP1|nr:hypothetical protein [Moorena producens]WAN70191.1 hypothetical protein BJP36_39760 [Moorena producens JHB]
MGYYGLAIDFLDYSVLLYGEDPDVFYHQGMFYLQLAEQEKAQAALGRVIK